MIAYKCYKYSAFSVGVLNSCRNSIPHVHFEIVLSYYYFVITQSCWVTVTWYPEEDDGFFSSSTSIRISVTRFWNLNATSYLLDSSGVFHCTVMYYFGWKWIGAVESSLYMICTEWVIDEL